MLKSPGTPEPHGILSDTPDGVVSRMAAKIKAVGQLAHLIPHLPYDTPLTLPGTDLTSARTARHHVREKADAHGLPAPLAYDLEIVTGELVANALEHTTSTTITFTCALTPHTALITVTDEGTKSCPLLVPDQDRGRGLLITDTLAARWGTCRSRRGLTVWAELSLAQPELPV